MHEQKDTILKTADKVTETVTENINKIIDEKFKLWDEQLENINERLENQDRRLNYLEKQARQCNLVFFGIDEDENSYLHMEEKIITFIHKYLKVNIDNRDIEAIRRIGKKSEKPRPVVVTFVTLGIKIKVLKSKTALKDTPYYIQEDYPPQILQKRKELQAQVNKEREKGNIAILKYDKLIILNKKIEYTPGNKKRVLSNSPENNLLSTKSKTSQVTKKNKTAATHSTQKSSNLTEGRTSMLNYFVSKNSNSTPDDQNRSDESK